MPAELEPDLRDLEAQLEAARRDAEALVAGLPEEEGQRRTGPRSWSIAQCLDHLARADREYLRAMREPAKAARRRGRLRRGPARPGVAGRLFVHVLEPPPKWWARLPMPPSIGPRPAPALREALLDFLASNAEARAFLRDSADLDLAATRFPNPFVPGIRFSLATGLHVIAAHERRHLWQAWRVRRTLERG